MGSSKSGSLDKFAAFSPAAALASGKVKLPETGIVGMLQAKHEDKMNYNSQMMQQQQMQEQKDAEAAQYMQMMQQQSGMNMGGRVGLSEGGEPSMERVLELEEQGFSYEEAYEKAMQELLDYKGGFAAGGRVGMQLGGQTIMNEERPRPERISQQELLMNADGGPPTSLPTISQQELLMNADGGPPTSLPTISQQELIMNEARPGPLGTQPATNPGPSSFEMTNTNTTNTGGMGSGTGISQQQSIMNQDTNSMLQNLIQQNPMLGQDPSMLGGYAAGGAVESMNFLKQHLPYQDGGHVALRRKMFKLGGPVNTHGVGITSGLEYRNNYNAGGRVGMAGGGYLDALEEAMEKGAKSSKGFGSRGKIAAILLGLGSKGINAIKQPYINPLKYIKGDPAKISANFLARNAARGIRGAATAGAYGLPVGVGSALADRAGLQYADPDSEAREGSNLLERGIRRIRQGGELATDLLTLPGEAFFIGDALTKDPDTEVRTLTDLIAGRDRKEIPNMDNSGVVSKTNMTREQLSARNQEENQARLQQAMEQYAELLAGSDDTDKLATLGDALIAGGSALMEGEGYGAAGRAFNEPLSASRRSKEERMQAANQAAAQLAISENMQIDAEKRAVVNEFMKTASYTDAEATELYNLALDAGVQRLAPEDDGELDVATLEQNPGVYADPKNLSTKGTLFLAVNSKQEIMPTNDPEEAKAHAAS